MLVDANLLLYAVDSASPFHRRASTWLESVLNGAQRVALPWQSLTAHRLLRRHRFRPFTDVTWVNPVSPD